MNDSLIEFRDPSTPHFFHVVDGDRILLEMKSDGTMTLYGNVNEAARLFLSAVGAMGGPAPARVLALALMNSYSWDWERLERKYYKGH